MSTVGIAAISSGCENTRRTPRHQVSRLRLVGEAGEGAAPER